MAQRRPLKGDTRCAKPSIPLANNGLPVTVAQNCAKIALPIALILGTTLMLRVAGCCDYTRNMKWQTSARFWSKVAVSGKDSCWIWHGARDERGYGLVRSSGKEIRAHRLALILSGVVPLNSQVVLHACDNPPCVNPAHLRAGTQSENIQEAHDRGRFRHDGIGLTPSILDFLKQSPAPVSSLVVAEAVGTDRHTARTILNRLAKRGEVSSLNGAQSRKWQAQFLE